MAKKRFLRTAVTLTAMLTVTLLAACEQAATPALPSAVPADAPGMGTVTVRVAAAGAPGAAPSPGAARTVAPGVAEIASAFDEYDLSFSGGGTTIPAKTVTAAAINTPIKLPEGTYTLTVTAKKESAEIARGTASVVIDSDKDAEPKVFLTPVTGGDDGAFSYEVTLPEGAKGALTLTGPAAREITLTEDDYIGKEENLPPGEYRLALSIANGIERVNFANEVVYLYSGLESAFTRDFASVALVEKTAEEILASLSALPQNTVTTPYTLDLSGIALTDLTTGSGSSTDPLGRLYEALTGRYVNLDLSGCAETVLANTSSRAVSSRKNEDKIVSVTLPAGLTTLGNSAFQGCTSLASIDLPASLATLGNSAFQGCTSLASIDLPTSLTTLGTFAFRDCTSLASIDLPDSLTSIGAGAFMGCSSLTSIDLPDSLESIGEDAFSNTSLTSIDLPETLTSIGDRAFSGCSSLTSIDLPDSLTFFGTEGTFADCKALTSITLPDFLTSIGMVAFFGCSSLTSIDLPDKVESIGMQAFQNCTALASITLPDKVKSIRMAAFQNCTDLVSIDLPDKVETIEQLAFQGCTKLASVISLNTTPPTLGTNAFDGTSLLTSIKVPSTSVTTYQSAWSAYSGKITALP